MVIIQDAFSVLGDDIKHSEVAIKDVPTLNAWSAVRIEFEQGIFLREFHNVFKYSKQKFPGLRGICKTSYPGRDEFDRNTPMGMTFLSGVFLLMFRYGEGPWEIQIDVDDAVASEAD